MFKSSYAIKEMITQNQVLLKSRGRMHFGTKPVYANELRKIYIVSSRKKKMQKPAKSNISAMIRVHDWFDSTRELIPSLINRPIKQCEFSSLTFPFIFDVSRFRFTMRHIIRLFFCTSSHLLQSVSLLPYESMLIDAATLLHLTCLKHLFSSFHLC